MMTVIQRSFTGLMVGIALGALVTGGLMWWWLGPRMDDQ